MPQNSMETALSPTTIHSFGGELVGVDVGLDAEDVVFGLLGSAGEFIGENKGYLKGFMFGLGLIVVGQESDPGDKQNFFQRVIENPVGVILATSAIGVAYGAGYSVINGLHLFRETRKQEKGEVSQAAKTVLTTRLEKTLVRLRKEATDPHTGNLDEAKYAELRLHNNAFPQESQTAFGLSEFFNFILGNTVEEFFEWLDVGVKLALVPAYLNSQMGVSVAKSIDMYQEGQSVQDILDQLTANIGQSAGVAVLGGAALLRDAMTAIKQRSNFFPTKKKQQQ